MADHVRKQIRDAVVAAVTGLPITEGRVFKSRVYPMKEYQLPGLLVYTSTEGSARDESPTDSMRDLGVLVQACAKIESDLDDLLDDIAKNVEVALDGQGRMNGLVKNYLGIQSTTFSFEGEELNQPHGAMAMEFLYTYRTASGAPDIPI